MMKYQKWMVLIVLLTLTASAFAAEYPKPTSWVNDYANVLSSSQKQELDGLLGDFETATTNQIFVCIMRSLPANTTLDEYVNELFERWQPGKKGNDNGALLAIFIDDRMLRIETGYGVEDKLTDAQSKLIIANDITPAFKQGNYYAGIKNGLIKMVRTIQPNYQPKISTTQTTGQDSSECGMDFGTLFTMIIVLIIVFNLFSRRRGGNNNLLMFILGMLLRGSGGGGYGRRSGWQSGPYYSPGRSSGSSGRSSSSSSRPKFSGGGGGRSGGGGASGRW